MSKSVESLTTNPHQEEKQPHRWWYHWRWVGFVVLAFLAWNGSLLWNLSRPVVNRGNNTITVQAAVDAQAPLPDELLYPRLGITAPLHDNPGTSPLRTQDWAQIADDLHHGVSLAYDAASLETAPLAYVTGHSSDTYPHPYSTVFAALGQAKIGDHFAVVTHNVVYTYSVVEERLAYPTDVGAFSIENSSKQHVLLVTCWPPLTTAERKIIVGERIL